MSATDKTEKYDRAAPRFTEGEYGDPRRYFARRAEIVLSLGPPLLPGETLLDLACADASFAEPVLAAGLRYVGVDASERMVEVARSRLGQRARIELGDLHGYCPAAPVAATVCFRSLHLVSDRTAFFRHVGGFTEKKLVFDVSPRRDSLAELRSQLRAAGFERIASRPFFVPQHYALPRPLAAALQAAERAGPLARLLLAFKFSYLCAAWR